MYIHIALRIVWRYLCTAQRRWFMHSETHGIKSRPRLRIKSLPKFWKLPRVPGAWHDSTLGVHFNEWMAREGHRFGLTTSSSCGQTQKGTLPILANHAIEPHLRAARPVQSPFNAVMKYGPICPYVLTSWDLESLEIFFFDQGTRQLRRDPRPSCLSSFCCCFQSLTKHCMVFD